MSSNMSSNTSSNLSLSQAASNIKTFVTVSLDHNNYLVWQTQVLNFLNFNGLAGFVDVSLPKPADIPPSSPKSATSSASSVTADKSSSPTQTTPQTAPTSMLLSADLWDRGNSFVLSCLAATLSDALSHHVLGFTKAADLWASLKELFIHHSIAKKSLLRNQLRGIKKHSLPMAECLQQIQFLASSLQAISEPISDSDLVLTALDGLPRDYQSFVTSIDNQSSPPSFSTLRAKLLLHEQRLLREADELDSSTAAPVLALLSHTSPQSLVPTALVSHTS